MIDKVIWFIEYRKEIEELTFRAFAFRQSVSSQSLIKAYEPRVKKKKNKQTNTKVLTRPFFLLFTICRFLVSDGFFA